jgi:hypothetical protein
MTSIEQHVPEPIAPGKDSNLIESPLTEPPKKKDADVATIANAVPSADAAIANAVPSADAAIANADPSAAAAIANAVPSAADATNVAEYKKAIAALNELLNKLKSDLETAPANVAEDIKQAIDIGTRLLNKLNAAIGTADVPMPVPVAADVPVPVPGDVPVAGGAAATVICGGVRASVLSSVDPSCYIAPDLPPLAQMVQAAFANEISTAGREIVMNFLTAAGIQGLEGSILTPATIAQIDALSHSNDPKVREQIANLQNNLKKVAGEAVTGIEKDVEPQLEKVVGDVEANAVGGLANAIAANPIIGDTEAIAQEFGAVTEVANQIPAIGSEISAELKPFKKLTDEVGAVTNSIPSVPSLPAAPSLPAVPSLTVPPVPSLTVPPVPSLTAAPNLNVDGGAAHVDAAPSLTVDGGAAHVDAGGSTPAPPKKGEPEKGGSRKRRRIHKLSRRIERTLRRVHRLKGDKNSFLRRTLRRGKP